MTSSSVFATLTGVTLNESQSRIVGYEILRRVTQADVPGYPLNPRMERAVLGAPARKYLVPPGIDLFELGLISMAGRYELLPVTADEKPFWGEVVHLVVTEAQAAAQRELLLRAYRTLHAMTVEADVLESSVEEWNRRREAHPVFGMLRLAIIDVWQTERRRGEPLSERGLDALHASVARRVAAQIRAHILN
jgi:hypothetical protein